MNELGGKPYKVRVHRFLPQSPIHFCYTKHQAKHDAQHWEHSVEKQWHSYYPCQTYSLYPEAAAGRHLTSLIIQGYPVCHHKELEIG